MVKYFWIPLFALVVIAGCAKDIIVEPPPALRGAYTAQITVIENFDNGLGRITSKAEADWTFTDYTFNYIVDEESAFNSDNYQRICYGSNGNYEWKSNIIIFTGVNVNSSEWVCSPDYTAPRDTFTIVGAGENIYDLHREFGTATVDLTHMDIRLIRKTE